MDIELVKHPETKCISIMDIAESLYGQKMLQKGLIHKEFVMKQAQYKIINLMIPRRQVANDLKNSRAPLKW